MGKAYNFKATLDETNISGEDGKELLPIVFDVQEVKDWVDAGEQAGVIAGAVEEMTLFTDVEATDRVVVSELLDGAGHTVSAVAGVNYVINNTARLIEAQAGSTIQNIKIDGKGNYTGEYGIRGIYTTGTGNVVVKNAEIVNCTYAINANNAGKLTVINSTLQGWNSYGSTTENHFENVKFIDGQFHNFRPYYNTVCKNCDFAENVVIDLSKAVDDATFKFIGCTKEGNALAAADFAVPAGFIADVDGDVITVKQAQIVATADELATAVENGAKKLYLLDGTYTFAKYPAGVELVGYGDNVVFDLQGKVYDVKGGDVAIENVKLVFSNANYKGFQHTNVESYKNCTIVGQPFLYGNDVTFEGCTFEQTSASAYNVWTYGAEAVKFVDCVFNCAGKSVLIYAEESSNGQVALFEGCELNASAPVTGKAAIEIDSSLIKGVYDITINDTTATGFANGNVSGKSLWNNKKGDKATITVDGVKGL